MIVTVVGTGLLGASVGLGLSRAGHRVLLRDVSPTAAELARDLGAGELLQDTPGAEPDVVVVAAPPDVAGPLIVSALREHPGATVTDVASIKSGILAYVREGTDGPELDRYIGSHPMAGRERSGAIAARHDLFVGRPWVICSDEDTPPERLAQVVSLVRTLGADPVHLDPDIHDAAVARVSHTPQVMASLTAGLLADAPAEEIALAGQGLRDVTRIAASDPQLWAQILAGNAGEVRALLEEVREDLGRVIDALAGGRGSVGALAQAIAQGREGQARIPGKHGQAPANYSTVTVLIDDSPGNLGRLFTDVGEIGVNIEDVRMEHASGRPLGIVELFVVPVAEHELVAQLRERGWRIPETEWKEQP